MFQGGLRRTRRKVCQQNINNAGMNKEDFVSLLETERRLRSPGLGKNLYCLLVCGTEVFIVYRLDVLCVDTGCYLTVCTTANHVLSSAPEGKLCRP